MKESGDFKLILESFVCLIEQKVMLFIDMENIEKEQVIEGLGRDEIGCSKIQVLLGYLNGDIYQ